MRAAVYDRPGPPEVLRVVDLPRPACPANGVVIRIEAISLEGGDLINRARSELQPGVALGYAAAGIIVEVGDEVSDREIGQRVTSWDLAGSHAEYRAVPALRTWIVPDALGLARAACVPIAFGAAHYCLFDRGGLQHGETVLIQAGAGGVGLAAIQLAHHAGATVIATVSGAERVERLKRLGLDHAIDYRANHVEETVKGLTAGQGVDLIVDPVGSTVRSSLTALRPEGRLVAVGNAGDGALEIDLWPVLQANQSVIGVFMGTQLEKPDIHASVSRLLDRAAVGEFEVIIDRRFRLDEIEAAHRYAQTTPIFGRVVVTP
ncbi:zinc-binding alcohol dehydrogenase family protein [Brevundimonas sp.]|jgi:NADPH2:quinone reductase|uniref:zinc-binding alcohol dehydrogenase family protein n=1 Tax=Brevundimonas sp. TaxID=1871086 RepID=UPI0037BF2FB0